MDATTLELDAIKFAQLAVQRDQSGRYQEAVFYYKVRRGRAGSLGAPVSPSPRRGPRDALELPEGSRSPFGPPRAGEEGSAPPRPGTALQAERERSGSVRPPPPFPGGCAWGTRCSARGRRGGARRDERGRPCVSVESLSVSGGAASFRAGWVRVLFLGGNERCLCADVYRQA